MSEGANDGRSRHRWKGQMMQGAGNNEVKRGGGSVGRSQQMAADKRFYKAEGKSGVSQEIEEEVLQEEGDRRMGAHVGSAGGSQLAREHRDGLARVRLGALEELRCVVDKGLG
eukprot:1161277-Pelagomonas_calceolata.AAC.5